MVHLKTPNFIDTTKKIVDIPVTIQLEAIPEEPMSWDDSGWDHEIHL